MVDNDTQKREFVDLETVVEINLEQSYEKKLYCDKIYGNEMANGNKMILTSQTINAMFSQMFHTLIFWNNPME